MPMQQNPFINRGLPLSELIARQGSISMEGESPFNQLMNRRELGNINQAIDRFGQRRPMQQQMMPRPQPRPMPQRPMPMPAVQTMQGPGSPGFAAPVMGGGTSPTVTVSGGAPAPTPGMTGGRPAPSFSGFWNALGLGGGGGLPGIGGGGSGMPGYGFGGGMNFGGGFRGFGPQQPYSGGGFNRLY